MEKSQGAEQIIKPDQQEFIKIDEHSELLRTAIDQENSRKSTPSINSSFDPAQLTECPKRILYRCGGTSHYSISSHLDIQSLASSKRNWVDFCEKCRGVKVLDRNVITADYEFNVTGQVDAIIRMDSEIYVVQIKPICTEDFKDVKQKGAAKKDVIETMVYN